MRVAARAMALTVLLWFVVLSVAAQQKENPPVGAQIDWQRGSTGRQPWSDCGVQIPDGYVFAGAKDTRMLLEAMHNPTNGDELGFLARGVLKVTLVADRALCHGLLPVGQEAVSCFCHLDGPAVPQKQNGWKRPHHRRVVSSRRVFGTNHRGRRYPGSTIRTRCIPRWSIPFAEFHQHPVGGFGMQEGDLGAACASAGFFIDQSHALWL